MLQSNQDETHFTFNNEVLIITFLLGVILAVHVPVTVPGCSGKPSRHHHLSRSSCVTVNP